MSRVLVIQNAEGAPPRMIRAVLEAEQAHVAVIRPYAGAKVEQEALTVRGIVVLGGSGGPQSEEAPWLADEVRLLTAALAAGTPVLGVCLGAQLLALAGGGSVSPDGPPEFGLYDLTRTQAGETDPLVGALPSRIRAVQMHKWHISALPPTATVLLASMNYPIQAFRLGTAWGFQNHPEVSASLAADWIDADPSLVAGTGFSAASAAGRLRRYHAETTSTWELVVTAWVRTCLQVEA